MQPQTAASTLPNWIRIVLILLSIISFVPQLRLLVHRRSSSGISLYYVLFNLISATEQFTISFLFTVNQFEKSDVFVETPPVTGDWLNLAQFTVVWILWLAIFALCLYFPSDRDSTTRPATVIAIYVTFLLISVVPVFTNALLEHPEGVPDGKWLRAMMHGFHSIFLNPIITLLGFAALLIQWRTLCGRKVDIALSPLALLLQAVIFAVATATWPLRLRFFEGLPDHGMWFSYLKTWYSLVGWVAIDNGIFALAQLILFWVMTRGRTSIATQTGETAPLLDQC